MAKGIDRAVTNLIFIVLVVAVGAVLLFYYAPYLQKIVSNFFPGQNQVSTDFDNALQCTYLRCTKGCDSQEVKSLTAVWTDPQTHSDVSCANFCQPGKTYCNADSQRNPVRIDIGETAYLAQDKLKSEFGTNCIISPDFQSRRRRLDKSTVDSNSKWRNWCYSCWRSNYLTSIYFYCGTNGTNANTRFKVGRHNK